MVDCDSGRRCPRGLSRLTDVLDGRCGRNSPSSKGPGLPRWLLYDRGRPRRTAYAIAFPKRRIISILKSFAV